MEIQKIRYRDILEYEIVNPKELEEFTIIKLTLQPIIENALYHGIKNKRGLGKITVTAEDMGEEIRFIVEDNGIGMKEETLERLRNVIDGKEVGDNEGGFGLVNVQERIKLYYGLQYGITFESNYGEGTKVSVLIPKL